ncbi:MAG TPA: aminotransferase class V-fold PLP-dependent enzyme [Candidatus Nanoarchaeia archaeon]|nr:aminotransferase class V-fold PLP-dependent enzyme [Candidatus Nanoarchaeia archaeon]
MNIGKIRKDFAILERKINGKPIVYLDSACQSLRPRQVVDKINQYYNEFPACGGRSMHKLGKKVTDEIAFARNTARKFFNARNEGEIVFTRNTTEGINLVANAFKLSKGDEVLISDKEHNSNLVPWLKLAKEKEIQINFFKFGDIADFQKKLSKKTRLVSFVHISNLDGTSNPAKELVKIAHDNGSTTLIDGAQSAPHREIDVRKLDADFFCCSGHKMLGPTGTGMLYGKQEILERLDTFMVGGETVIDTTYNSANFEKPPAKFEAGLQDYAGIIGFAEAMKYLKNIGLENIEKHEMALNKKVTDKLAEEVELLGPKDSKQRAGIFSFNIKGMDFHNISVMLDSSANIMIRSGVHCCHSWFNANHIKGSARASFYLYNTEEECELLIEEVKKIRKLFGK